MPLPKKVPAPHRAVAGVKAILIPYSGGLKSYYEPCGCQADMLGGLPRLGALFAGWRHQGHKLLPLDAGNLFFETLKISKAKRKQAELKAEMVADMFRILGYRAVGVGPSDLVFGVKHLQALHKKTGAVGLSANIADAKTGKLLFAPHALLHHQGTTFGVFSLTQTPKRPSKKDPWPAKFWQSHQLKLRDHTKAARAQIAALRKKGAKRIILLSTLGFSRAEALVAAVKGIDLVIEGSEGVELVPPRLLENTFLVSTPEEGQKAGVLALYPRNTSWPWAMVQTAQGRQAAIKKMHAQVANYRKQAAQMRAQGADFAPIAKVYDDQAKALLAKIAKSSKSTDTAPRLKAKHNGFLAFMISLSKVIPDHPEAAKRQKRYEQEVKVANLAALKNIKPIPKTKDGNFYVGVSRCRLCHMPAYNFWKKTRHARAYPTLVKKGKQFDLDCIGCHVVGWQKPGGLYDIKNPQRLANVQCENCHSYGGLHASTGDKKRIHRNVTAKTCTTCHQGTHDPKFNFHKKVQRILGKGHGEKRLQQLRKKKS